MSKSQAKKKIKNGNAGASNNLVRTTVNTLGIDIEPMTDDASLPEYFTADKASALPEELAGFELPDENTTELDDGMPLPVVERIINYATLALSMLLLGGSLVFWWIIGRYLIIDPSYLVDSEQMRAVLISCAIVPVFVTIAQVLLKRPISIERWLICMCISGAMSALIVIVYQLGFRGDEFTFADYPTLICCTVSGCTLPSAIYIGIRWLIPIAAGFLKKRTASAASESWDDVSEDVCSFTDFDF